jgi:hypothetical protein
MTIRSSTRFSPEGVAAQVSLLEESAGSFEVPLAADETVTELQDAAEYYMADAASELMTGIRWQRKRREYLKRYGVYRRLLGAVALDIAGRTYDEEGDIGNVKHDVFGYLRDSNLQMVALDYELRLMKSYVERHKQWLAYHYKTRLVLPVALSAASTAALFKAGEASSSFIDMPSQSGTIGLATVAGGLAIRSALRSGPRQAGVALKRPFNATIRPYILEAPAESSDNDQLPAPSPSERYAARHLIQPLGAAAIYLVDCEAENKDDFAPMIEGLLDVTEASMHESYGIDPEEGRGPFYRRWPSRMFRVDMGR